MTNIKVLVTAGPTYEAIDPVRFIGNHSSGKMGYAIAEELARNGADVTLISGPTSIHLGDESIKKISITSAAELLDVCLREFEHAAVCVMTAAVADYTPAALALQKIKKEDEHSSIALKKTTDILFELGSRKKNNQILVGFALETHNEEEYATQKLQRKNLDFIVLNSLNDEGAGFKKETNKITIIDKDFHKTSFALKTKAAVAKDICAKIIAIL